MPVHPNHRVVHLHIPKTAGTQVGDIFAELGDMSWEREHWYGTTVIDGRHVELQHLSLVELREFSHREFDSYHTFAVVRDPYQRLISEYHWRHRSRGLDPLVVRPVDTFEELVASIPWDLDHNWSRYAALADGPHANLLTHLRPQWQSVCDSAGRRDPAVQIVHFERLGEELTPLLQRWHVPVAPPWHHRAPRNLAEYFTPETMAVVNRVYAQDFEWFGYELRTTPT